MPDGETNHGQTALTEAVVKAMDRCVAEWNITPVEIVGVLNMLATAVIVNSIDLPKGGTDA